MPKRSKPAVYHAPEVSIGSNVGTSDVKVNPEHFPSIDARWINEVISGNWNLRNAMRNRDLTPVDDGTSELCRVGTGQGPENCRDINVWGLSEKVTEEELLSSYRKFGAVRGIMLLKSKVKGRQCFATITFDERSSAQKAKSSLDRTFLHDKEIHVRWGQTPAEWETDGHHWLYVWITKGTTVQQLYNGFRHAGAPVTGARVVREGSDGEEGVGALAFRDEEERTAVCYGLPVSCKTDWTKHPTYSIIPL